MMTDYIKRDLIGERFGKLTVIERAGTHKSPCGTKRSMWLCRCDCGGETVASRNNLTSGALTSCGCVKTEKLKKLNTTHGGTHDRLYQIWRSMKQRCSNPQNKAFKYYGAVGINVCEEWEKDYQTFKTWAYENGYDENAELMKCTIDRIDPNRNYEPSNCRWVDMFVQNDPTHKRKAE